MGARTIVRWLAPPLVVFAGGAIALILAGGSAVWNVFGILLVGGGAIWLVSLAFYAVGRSEDRDREREAAERAAARRPPSRPAPRRRPSLPRRRDHRT